ncbi:hypothetical protein BU17DRAFT_69027 [Hysterangium stoloniferum]|nr:hypothetical protein BU17DRAFT_69027 [Hysterangium stoloniferum]
MMRHTQLYGYQRNVHGLSRCDIDDTLTLSTLCGRDPFLHQAQAQWIGTITITSHFSVAFILRLEKKIGYIRVTHAGVEQVFPRLFSRVITNKVQPEPVTVGGLRGLDQQYSPGFTLPATAHNPSFKTLFSDGYANNVIGSVVTLLRKKYGKDIITAQKGTLLSSLAFAGTVLGMFIFGYLSDKLGRKFGMVLEVRPLVLFPPLLLTASSSVSGLAPNILVVALLPANKLKKKTQRFPKSLVVTSDNFGENHLSAVWRGSQTTA